jgi:hypothetical protein
VEGEPYSLADTIAVGRHCMVAVVGRQTHRPRQPVGPFVVRAIGRDGWPVAERPVDRGASLQVVLVADELRAQVLADVGWLPRIVVVDARGRDVSEAFEVG